MLLAEHALKFRILRVDRVLVVDKDFGGVFVTFFLGFEHWLLFVGVLDVSVDSKGLFRSTQV